MPDLMPTEHAPEPHALAALLLNGDLSRLKDTEILSYYQALCRSLGLNPLTKPFDWITLNNRKVLYATRNCTDQLRYRRRINLQVIDRQKVEGLFIVTVRATLPDGRMDEEIGAVAIDGLKGDGLANAYMKASTKAKRRATLSICGLSFPDEGELDTMSIEINPSIQKAMERKEARLNRIEGIVRETHRPAAIESDLPHQPFEHHAEQAPTVSEADPPQAETQPRVGASQGEAQAERAGSSSPVASTPDASPMVTADQISALFELAKSCGESTRTFERYMRALLGWPKDHKITRKLVREAMTMVAFDRAYTYYQTFHQRQTDRALGMNDPMDPPDEAEGSTDSSASEDMGDVIRSDPGDNQCPVFDTTGGLRCAKRAGHEGAHDVSGPTNLFDDQEDPGRPPPASTMEPSGDFDVPRGNPSGPIQADVVGSGETIVEGGSRVTRGEGTIVDPVAHLEVPPPDDRVAIHTNPNILGGAMIVRAEFTAHLMRYAYLHGQQEAFDVMVSGKPTDADGIPMLSRASYRFARLRVLENIAIDASPGGTDA